MAKKVFLHYKVTFKHKGRAEWIPPKLEPSLFDAIDSELRRGALVAPVDLAAALTAHSWADVEDLLEAGGGIELSTLVVTKEPK